MPLFFSLPLPPLAGSGRSQGLGLPWALERSPSFSLSPQIVTASCLVPGGEVGYNEKKRKKGCGGMDSFRAKKGYLCDMDGVIYHGNGCSPG